MPTCDCCELGACCKTYTCAQTYKSQCKKYLFYEPDPVWLGPGTSCDDCPPPTGACCVEGECSVTTEAECAELAGTWQGDFTDCSLGDCTDTCCIPEGDCPNIPYFNCRAGYFGYACENLGGTPTQDCTGFTERPLTGNPFCDVGTDPATVTVTIAGVVANNSAYNALANACNGAFVFDLPCGWQSADEIMDLAAVSGYAPRISVILNLSAGTVAAGLAVTQVGYTTYDGFRNEDSGRFSSAYADCSGRTVYDCSDYTLAAGQTSSHYDNNILDFTSATIAIS